MYDDHTDALRLMLKGIKFVCRRVIIFYIIIMIKLKSAYTSIVDDDSIDKKILIESQRIATIVNH
jgi:hypothetical protein